MSAETTIEKATVRVSYLGRDITLIVYGSSTIARMINACYKAFNLEEYQFEASSWYLRDYCPSNGSGRFYYDNTPLSQTEFMHEWIEDIEDGCTIFLNLLNQNGFKIPPRNDKFIQWVKSDDSTVDDIPEGIPYPADFITTGLYHIKTRDDRLWSALYWLEFDVANKLIDSGIFNLNMTNGREKMTPLNVLCTKYFPDGMPSDGSKNKEYLALIAKILNSDDIDIETSDIYHRTALANVVMPKSENCDKEIAKLLLRHGANINESVVKAIYYGNFCYLQPAPYEPNLWVYDLLKEIRCIYGNVIENILITYELNDISEIVLDYMLCNPNVKSKFDKEMKEVCDWLTDTVKLPQYYNKFIGNNIINMREVSKCTFRTFSIPNLTHAEIIENAMKQLNKNNEKIDNSKKVCNEKRKLVDDIVGLDEIKSKKRKIN